MNHDQPKVHIGMGGWDLEPFDRVFYPPRSKQGFRKLEYYSQFFDAVEIHTSFYNSSLTADHARQWLRDVVANRRFIFSAVKLFRGFTHTFEATRQDVLAVHRMLEPLEEAGKLGGLLIQFPYSFTNIQERRLYVMQLAKIFQPHRLLLEVRHDSWNSPLMYNFFQENKLHLVNVDLPPVKRSMPLTAVAWSGVGYIRLMGRNTEAWWDPAKGSRYNYYYTPDELKHLLHTLEQMKTGLHSLHVVFNNDGGSHSFVNGFQLRYLLRAKQPVLVPEHLVQAFPELKPMSASVNVSHPLFAEMQERLSCK